MKVGTDGVLLGAWADVSKAKYILDIGTGTGLISLMVAQRSEAEIVALEIDSDAADQARENVSASPWSRRITVEQKDFCLFQTQLKFDVIVSNPPYFVNSLKSPDKQRNGARHTGGLNFYNLITKAATLLFPDGQLSLIIPVEAEKLVMKIAAECNLFPAKQTYIQTTPGAFPKRLLVSYELGRKECVTDYLTVELSRHIYSEEYINLTEKYYLNM